MAKPIKIPAQINLTLHNLQNVKEQIDILNKNIGSNLSDSMSQQLVSLSSFIDSFIQKHEASFASGKMKPEELKTIVDTMNSIADAAGRAHKEISKEMVSSPHSFFSSEKKQEIKEVGDEILKVGDKIDETLKRQESREAKNFASLQSSTRFKDLALDHLVNYDAMINKLIRDEKTYQRLREKSQEGKLSSTEKQRLATLKDTAKARQHHIRQAEESNKKTEDETKVIEELVQELIKLKNELAELEKQGTAEVMDKISDPMRSLGEASREGKIQFSSLLAEVERSAGSLNIFSNLWEKSKKNLVGFLTGVVSGHLVIKGLNSLFKETVRVVKDLDKAFNEMAMVTTMTNKEAWQLKNSITDIASATGHTITEVTELSVQFFRQGRSISETIKLTNAAAAAAKVAGISSADSVNYLTSAINGFHLSASQAMVVSDKFAALAASSASSYEELAKALSKVAAQAYTVGVDMDNLMAFIAKGLEVTREAPENIGTAFKTIFARMAELKDLGKTMEDGMSIGRVDTALKQVGISLTDATGEIRNLDEVLIELGHSWDSLSKNQKAYAAVALAGTRQQARLLAVMEDFGRTMELADISTNSLGATLTQQEKYTNSLAFALNQVAVAWQEIVSSLGSAEIFTTIIKFFAGFVTGLHEITQLFGGLPKTIGLVTITTLGLIAAKKLLSLNASKALITSLATAKAEGRLTGEYIKQIFALQGVNVQLKIKEMISKRIAASNVLSKMFSVEGLVIMAVVAALAFLAKAYVDAKRKNKDMVEGLKTSQAEIYNLRKKASDLNSLGEEYDKINKKINKTNEDLERQREIIEQIGDLAEGYDPGAGGASLSQFIKDSEEALLTQADNRMAEAISGVEKSHGSLIEAYKGAVAEGSVEAQQTLLLAKAMELAGYEAHEYSKYIKETTEAQKDLYYAQSRLSLENEKDLLKTSSARNPDGTPAYVPDNSAIKAHNALVLEAQEIYKDLFEQGFNEADFRTQISLLTEMGEISSETQEMLAGMIPGYNNILTAIESMGVSGVRELENLMNTSSYSTDYLITLANKVSSLDLIPDNLKSGFLKRSLTDLEDAMHWLESEFVKAGKTSSDFYNVLTQINNLVEGKTLLDLDGVAKGIGSIYTNLDELNKMLEGQADFQMDYVYSMLQEYPELYDIIANGEELTVEKMEEVAKARTESFKQELEQKRISLEIALKNIDNELHSWESFYTAVNDTTILSGKQRQKIEELAEKDIAKAKDYINEQVAKNKIQIGEKAILTLLDKELAAAQTLEEQAEIRERKRAVGRVSSGMGVSTPPEVGDYSKATDQINRQIKETISQHMANRTAILDEMAAIDLALNSLERFGTLQGLSAKKDAASKQAAFKAAKEYEGKITALYIALQQLAALEHELSNLETRRKYTESGEEYVALTKSINEGLLEKNRVITEISRLQREEQQYTLDNLGSLNKYVRVVNGKLKIAISDYNKLTDDQKKLIDETITSYDGLTDSINQNSISVKENTAEIEANNKILRDKTIELHNLLADALKNQKKKELDIIKKGITEERKLLDERRKLYEDSFNEEDYLDELSELDEERQDVINQLAQLEGATGATANKKRQELLDRKAELDKQYNTKVRDYNREALFESIQMEQEALDEKEQAAQDYYDQYISDTERLQQDINNILEQGVENTVQFLIDHHTSYIGALDLAKEDLEKEWGFLAEQVEAAGLAVDGLPEEWKLKYDIPDFVAITNNVADLVDALKKIPANTSTTHTNYRQNIQLKDQDLNQNKATDWKPVGDSFVQGMALYQKYERTMADGTKQTKTEKIDDYIGATSKPAKTTVSGGSSGQTYMAFASGGEADFTGPMWVDGTKRRPERILSPVQTELFNRMVSQLERSGGPIGQDFNLGPINVSLATGSTSEAREAASRIYDELKSVMKSRGLVANTKITKY